MTNHTITKTKGEKSGSRHVQLFGVVRIRDVWLNDLGEGPSLIWDNKARKWRELDDGLYGLIQSWEWPFGKWARPVGVETWNIDSSPWVIDHYIAIRWELIEEHGLEWAVVDTLEAPGVEDLPFLIDVDHPSLPSDV